MCLSRSGGTDSERTYCVSHHPLCRSVSLRRQALSESGGESCWACQYGCQCQCLELPVPLTVLEGPLVLAECSRHPVTRSVSPIPLRVVTRHPTPLVFARHCNVPPRQPLAFSPPLCSHSLSDWVPHWGVFSRSWPTCVFKSRSEYLGARTTAVTACALL